MARIALVVILLVWLAWTPRDAASLHLSVAMRGSLFLGFYAGMILGIGLWARWLARDAYRRERTQALHRFNRLMLPFRILVVAWFAFGMFVLDWRQLLWPAIAPFSAWDVQTLPMLLGTLPALLAWTALWWAQYPVEQAIRERRTVMNVNAALPTFIPPSLGEYLMDNFRTGLLFTLTPIVGVFALRDVATLALRHGNAMAAFAPDGSTVLAMWDLGISLGSALLVLMVSPVVLTRILPTQPLPPSPLRARLERFCHKRGLRIADIRLWRTHGMVANAAVMGILPPVRYLIISDLVIESMPPEQVEAVFAHEAGHVVHHHLLWIGLTILTYIMASAILGDAVIAPLVSLPYVRDVPAGLVSIMLGLPVFWLVFGFVARRIERQADVFAARVMQQEYDLAAGEDFQPGRRLRDSRVGPAGALVTAAALRCIALANNFSLTSHEWLHGSIESRMRVLCTMGEDSDCTHRFDQYMRRLYLTILFILVGLAIWAIHDSMQP